MRGLESMRVQDGRMTLLLVVALLAAVIGLVPAAAASLAVMTAPLPLTASFSCPDGPAVPPPEPYTVPCS